MSKKSGPIYYSWAENVDHCFNVYDESTSNSDKWDDANEFMHNGLCSNDHFAIIMRHLKCEFEFRIIQ